MLRNGFDDLSSLTDTRGPSYRPMSASERQWADKAAMETARANRAEEELKRITAQSHSVASPARNCDHCGSEFTPRAGSGGKPQRFCSPECRQAFHAERQDAPRKGTVSSVSAAMKIEMVCGSGFIVGENRAGAAGYKPVAVFPTLEELFEYLRARASGKANGNKE